MLNGTWPQIHQIKIHQSPKFSNLPNFSPSKISHYIYIYILDECGVWSATYMGSLYWNDNSWLYSLSNLTDWPRLREV